MVEIIPHGRWGLIFSHIDNTMFADGFVKKDAWWHAAILSQIIPVSASATLNLDQETIDKNEQCMFFGYIKTSIFYHYQVTKTFFIRCKISSWLQSKLYRPAGPNTPIIYKTSKRVSLQTRNNEVNILLPLSLCPTSKPGLFQSNLFVFATVITQTNSPKILVG